MQFLVLTTRKQEAFENTVGKGENAGDQNFLLFLQSVSSTLATTEIILATLQFVVCKCFLFSEAPPGWLSGERVRLMTWWL